MMQSSPPHRAWERPSSPAESRYSLDLDALELDSPDNTSTPLPQQQVDTVRSEDIDGPSDFTLNMVDWMRGGSLKRGKTGSLKGIQNIPVLQEEESVVSADDKAQSPTLPEPAEEAADADEVQTASHHTPTNSPPRESVLLSSLQNRASLSPRSSPKINFQDAEPARQFQDHLHFLQPTVEDDYSELTPGHLPPAQPNVLSQHRAVSPPAGQALSNAQFHDFSPPAGQPLGIDRPPNRIFTSQTDEADHQRLPDEEKTQQPDLETRCWQLQRLNATLKQAIEDERRQRQQETAMYRTKLAESTRASNSKANVESEHAEELLALREAHVQELQRLRDQMDSDRSEHSRKIRSLQQDLDLTRISRDNAEEAARSEREELEELRENHDQEMDRIGRQMQQIDDLNAQVSEFNEQFKSLNMDNANLAARAKDAEGVARDLRAELELSKQTQNEHTSRTNADYQRIVDRAEDLQTKLSELQTRFDAEQAAREAELKRIETEQPIANEQPSGESEQLREQTEARQSELNSAVIDRDAAQDELESARARLENSEAGLQAAQSELEALRLRLGEAEIVNTVMDKRISDAISRRESYWEARVEKMERERKLMAKALMDQWGREEIGIEEPLQGYLYRYLKRHEKGVREARDRRSAVLSKSSA